MTTANQAAERVSAVEFAPVSRMHVAINVSNVEKSLPFYKALFNQEPTKVRSGYAKFEVAEPAVNFTLNENPDMERGKRTLSHFGIQVKSTAAVLAAKEQFIQSGLATFDEEDVTCCYAVQDKVWVTDPDGNNWEVFVVLDADAPEHSANRMFGGPADSCACAAGSATTASGKKTIELVSRPANACC